MKSKKKKIGDVGIRLKPNDPNILENYVKYRKRTRKKKKKKSKRKKSYKSIEIKEKKDPFSQLVEESRDKRDDLIVKELEDLSEKDDEEEHDKPIETRTIHVDSKPKDLSETDPNVNKTVMITASLKPEKKKEGTGVILE